MTEIPIVVSTNEITVGGVVDQIELQLGLGEKGDRGSRIFSGDVSPLTLPPTHAYFGGISEFVLGDMFMVRSGATIGDVWEYRAQPGGNDWVKIINRWSPPMYSGVGSPNGVISAGVGALYTRTDGGANTTLYVKESGVGNTGWVAK